MPLGDSWLNLVGVKRRGIPPISLVAVVVALVPMLVKRKVEHDKKERDARPRRESE
jgi:hypothetical protein